MTCLNVLEKKFCKNLIRRFGWSRKVGELEKSNQNIVMDEELVQNIVMDEELVQDIVMDEELVQNVTMCEKS